MHSSHRVEWIASLFKSACPFCLETLGDPRTACHTCAREMEQVSAFGPVLDRIDDLPLIAAAEYRTWIQTLVLRQKTSMSRQVVSWMSTVLHAIIPESWHDYPVVWVPPGPWSDFHLTEALAYGLFKHGHELFRRTALRRRHGYHRPQKALDLTERESRDVAAMYAVNRTAPGRLEKVILLDDIVTTGSTIRGCRALLEQKGRFQVVGCLCFARTPRKTKKTGVRLKPYAGQRTIPVQGLSPYSSL